MNLDPKNRGANIDAFRDAVQAAEKDVCGTILRGSEFLDAARATLTFEDFIHPIPRGIFRVACQMRDEGIAVNLSTVLIHLRKSAFQDDQRVIVDLGKSPESTLSEYYHSVVSTKNLKYTMTLVKEASLLRSLVGIGNEISQTAAENGAPATEIAAEQIGNLLSISQGHSERGPVEIAKVGAASVDRYNRYSNGQRSPGIQSNLTGLDKITGGFMNGQLTILAARPSVGKSALMAQFLLAASKAGVPSLVFTIEMSRDEMYDRMMAQEAEVSMHRLRGILPMSDDDAYRIVNKGHEVLNRLPVFIDDRTRLKSSVIAATIRHYTLKQKVGIVFVDYLQLIAPENPRDAQFIHLGESCLALKNAAKECGVPVICLAQLNRENQSRTDSTPRMSDIKGSGDIEQHADVVLLLNRLDEDDSLERHQIDIIVDKNRHGPRGKVETEYLRRFTKYVDRVQLP